MNGLNPKKHKLARRKERPVNVGGHLIPRDILQQAQEARVARALKFYARKRSLIGRILVWISIKVDKLVTLYLCRGLQ